MVPVTLKHQIIQRYELLEGRMEEGNPIKRIRVVASNVDGIVWLDKIQLNDDDEEGGGGTGEGGALARGGQQWRNVIYAKLCTAQTNVGEIRNHQLSELAELKRQIRTVTGIVRGLSLAPACCHACYIMYLHSYVY
mmetsp:Transcript_19055/g.53103  ORF Transcript_19055/g.53103 Transcript_19055/m.53103 type:complete len:136 (-) Transcript_19055:34-441(-)